MRLKHVKNADSIIKEGKYYVEDASQYKGKWKEVFGNKNPIHVEIGMGKGKFLIENASMHPEINYIGIEKYDSVLVRAVQASNTLELPNLKLIRLDANKIEDIFDHEISLIYLNFSDPWPKERHAKRRLTSDVFLKKYDLLFQNEPHIKQKTDNTSLFQFSLESLEENGYQILYQTNDLHQENIFNIMTEYEEKFSSLGIKIHYLEAKKEINLK